MDALAQHWQLALGCFVAGYALAAWLHGKRRNAQVAAPRNDISESDIEAALRAGDRIEAIKLCRGKYGYGLKAAVNAVDAMATRLGVRI